MSNIVLTSKDKPSIDFLSAREKFDSLPAKKRLDIVKGMSDEDIAKMQFDWEFNGRPKQLAPDHEKSKATSYCMCRYLEAQSKTEKKLRLESFPGCPDLTRKTDETDDNFPYYDVKIAHEIPSDDGWKLVPHLKPEVWIKFVKSKSKVCSFRKDWSTWVLLAGRGFGKTRVGAELAREMVETDQAKRVAIISPTSADARDVAVEGESGLTNICPPWNKPLYESTKRRVTWQNGAIATLFSAEEPERLRGPQFDFAWCLVAGTLVETEFGKKPIETVKVNDRVWTRKGLKRVYDVQMTGVKPIFDVLLSNGIVLSGTGEHNVWVEEIGWLELQKLTPGAKLLAFEVNSAPTRIASVEPRLSQINVTKKNGRQVEKEVWNLSIEDEHEFFANGVLVKNCDEIAGYDINTQQMTWDMLQFCLRLGDNPRAVVTTTPKPTPLIQQLVKLARHPVNKVIMTTGSTYENKTNLAAPFMRQITQYEGTNLGRQEIYAELIDIEESGILKRSWFKQWSASKAMPLFDFVIQSYDTAFTEKTENDPTGCVVFGVFRPDPDSPHCVMILDCWTDHLKFPELRQRAKDDFKATYGDQEAPVDLLLIEDKGSGIPLIQDLQRAGLPIRKYNPGRPDKVMRLHAVSHLVYNGRVYIPESKSVPGEFVTWAEDYLREVCSFPNSPHDEYVDCTTQALSVFRDQEWLSIDPVQERPEFEDDETWGNVYENPYAV